MKIFLSPSRVCWGGVGVLSGRKFHSVEVEWKRSTKSGGGAKVSVQARGASLPPIRRGNEDIRMQRDDEGIRLVGSGATVFLHAHAPRDDVDSGGPNWYC